MSTGYLDLGTYIQVDSVRQNRMGPDKHYRFKGVFVS